jgi:hypothetical protein
MPISTLLEDQPLSTIAFDNPEELESALIAVVLARASEAA